jgi:hypothetical protein
MLRRWAKLATATVTTMAAAAVPALAATDHLVTVGSPQAPRTFPENKQNEPGLALDANNPGRLAAGSNDEIDDAFCSGNSCPFTPGVGVSGFYFSSDGSAASWAQPTYQGLTARGQVGGDPHQGPIGTLPHYDTNGLASDGDPTLAYGPRPDPSGHFSWANGSRLYYGNLTANLSTVRKDQTFRGFEAIAVSRSDDNGGSWSDPVIASAGRQKKKTFSDKDTVWADNAATSSHFGNVYLCYTDFTNGNSDTAPEPIVVARSTDGGSTFSRPVKVSKGRVIKNTAGRQGCTVRTDHRGTVYVFWEDSLKSGASAQFMARSFDGGKKYEAGHAVAAVEDVGLPDKATTDVVFDGYAGTRTDSFPSVDIANGAPSGQGAPDTIALAWADGPTTIGGPPERALVRYSHNRGDSFTSATNVAAPGDRPDFPSVALSPNGQRAYVVYDAFTSGFKTTTAAPRPMQGVVRSGTPTVGDTFATAHRGAVGDARGSSANALDSEFIGDYNWVVATNSSAVATFNDVRAADDCRAIDVYRQALIDGSTTATPPAPNDPAPGGCGNRFGNTDIYSVRVP